MSNLLQGYKQPFRRSYPYSLFALNFVVQLSPDFGFMGGEQAIFQQRF